MEQQIRMISAAVISMIIVVGWHYYFAPDLIEERQLDQNIEQDVIEDEEKVYISQKVTVEEGFAAGTRIPFENEFVSGSVNLVGAQIDNLILKKYKNDTGDDNVALLSPNMSEEPDFITLSWKAPKGENIELPSEKTVWAAIESCNEPLTLIWTNGQGVVFEIKVHLDDKYMFHIGTSVDFRNATVKSSKIRTKVNFQRSRNISAADSMILHEGVAGVIGDQLKEVSFSNLKKDPLKISKDNRLDWIGFSDKYWLVSLIPTKKEGFAGALTSTFSKEWDKEKFNMDIILPKHEEEEGDVISDSFKIFAGAKSIEILDTYQKQYDIKMFDRAVDLGFLYFITKPIFLVLNYFYKLIGNFGLAIMLLTVLIKVLLFPLAYKSVKSMNNVKRLQPKIAKLKEQYADNNMLFQQALMSLYKKEKVNPASGCLPIILQMPIFFALYKVLYVTIEMRHAPFFWWIKDLSAPDSTTIFNLFGLIPWTPPSFLMIGVLPILMSATMFIQQLSNPQPADETQAMMMKIMPLMLLFMFSGFPSGLLIYWTWSNIISIMQQLVIKKLPE